jgi:hypothetical protein
MPQIFSRGASTIARVSVLGIPLRVAGVLWLCILYTRSTYGSGAGFIHV